MLKFRFFKGIEKVDFSSEKLLELYRKMLLIRLSEEKFCSIF